MTTLRFTLKNLEGELLPNTQFKISAGYPDDTYDPELELPANTLFTTDNNGEALVTLAPLSVPYYLTRATDTLDDMIAFKFFVPNSATVLEADFTYVDLGSHLHTLADNSMYTFIETKVALANAVEQVTISTIAATEAASAAATSASAASSSAMEAAGIATELNTHITNANAHPQYQRKDAIANDSDALWCGTADGTANAITLSLPALPVAQVYPAYKDGTRFTFKASANNTLAVTVNIGGLGVKNVTKAGGTPLTAADIKAGGVYEIVYDGSNFQISGSVGGSGSSQVFEVQGFTGAGPYTLNYTVGRVSAYLNGLLLSPSDFTATNGVSIAIPSATAGDEIVFICYSTFLVANTYTIAEVNELIPKGRDAVVRYVSTTQVKLSPYGGRRLLINGRNENIPSGGITVSNLGLSANTLYYLYAYMSGGAMAVEAVTTLYSNDPTGDVSKFNDQTRALVGMLKTTSGGLFDASLVRSWYNDDGIFVTGRFNVNRSVSDSVASAAWVELSSEIRANFLVWYDDIVSVQLTGGALINLGNSDDAYGFVALAFDGVTAEDGASMIGAPAIGALSSNDWSPIAVNRRRSGLSEGAHYATVIGRIMVTAGTGIDLVCLGSGITGMRTFLQVSTLPRYR